MAQKLPYIWIWPYHKKIRYGRPLVVGMSYKMSDNMLSVILWTDKLRNLWPPEVPPGGLYGSTWWQIAFQAIMYQIGPQTDEKPHFVQ